MSLRPLNEAQERTVKKAGNFYGDVIRAGGVTGERHEKYVKAQNYHF